jgi:hypothetical protein
MRKANGDVAPIRFLAGNLTGLASPSGIAIDDRPVLAQRHRDRRCARPGLRRELDRKLDRGCIRCG